MWVSCHATLLFEWCGCACNNIYVKSVMMHSIVDLPVILFVFLQNVNYLTLTPSIIISTVTAPTTKFTGIH